MQKLLAGQVVDPKLVYFRTQPKFETSAAELQWLTTNLFVGVGERFPNEVVIRFFRSSRPLGSRSSTAIRRDRHGLGGGSPRGVPSIITPDILEADTPPDHRSLARRFC